MRFFAPLLKIEDGEDDTLKVTGIASAESPDRQGEIVKASAVKAALPDFFAHGTGALREMHGLSAAGTVDDAEIDEANKTLITATVVDPVAIKKVRAGVYKGFSIGGRVVERDRGNRKIITKISLNEISLVDRPANPEAVIDLWKADTMEKPEAAAKEQDIVAEDGTQISTDAPAMQKSDGDGAVAEPAADETARVDENGEAKSAAPDALTKATEAMDRLEQAVENANDDEGMTKGLYEVGRMGEVLSTLAYLVTSGEYEAEREGDNSPVPGRLREWLKVGAAIFKDMAKEEIDELVALVAVKKAEAAEPLAKSGEPSDDLAKAVAERDELLSKLAERDEALTKLAERTDDLLGKLSERLARIEAQPAPPKTAGPLAKAVSVSKEEDATGITAPDAQMSKDDLAKAIGAMSEEDRTLLLIKAAKANPMMVGTR